MKQLLLFLLLLLFFNACQDVGDNKPLLSNSKKKQPIIIVNQNRHLNMAEYWIDKLDQPNEIIMTPKEIEKFNNKIAYENRTINYFKDINKKYGSEWVKKSILHAFNGIKSGSKYFTDGSRVSATFYKNIKERLNLKTLFGQSVTSRYAILIKKSYPPNSHS